MSINKEKITGPIELVSGALNVINNLHRQKQVKNIHIIINDFQHTSTGYGYGYGYGYGSSGYGYYENEND